MFLRINNSELRDSNQDSKQKFKEFRQHLLDERDFTKCIDGFDTPGATLVDSGFSDSVILVLKGRMVT